VLHGPAIERLDVIETCWSTKHDGGEMWLIEVVLETVGLELNSSILTVRYSAMQVNKTP